MLRTGLLTLLLATAAPAMAVTTLSFQFGGTAGTASSLAYTQGSLTITATARRFFPAPSSLTQFSQTVASGVVRRTTPGIGINVGGDNVQIDTNIAGTVNAPAREALLLTGNQDFSLRGLRLSAVDIDDTLKIYGVLATGALVDLGYGSSATAAGAIRGGLDGTAIGLTFSSANSGTSTFGVAPTDYYSRYLFTTRVGGDVNFLGTLGQGYRLDALTAGVPEPATWGLMLVGFGMVGVSLRRRSAMA